MDAVKKARARLRTYPALLKDCSTEAQMYAKCVMKFDDVRKDNCALEFKEFMSCVKNSCQKRNTRF